MSGKVIDQKFGDGWAMYRGDCVEAMDGLPSDSIGLMITSPPFPGMYVYTNSAHDMGNVQSIEECIDQMAYLTDPNKLMRVMMPGRSVFIHITQAVAQKGRDGYMGMKDFRGPIISTMSEQGWHYYGEITIQKDPQLKAIRTKDHGLMFKSLANDAAKMHAAMPDIVLQFRKAGENPVPIRAGFSEKYGNPDGWVTQQNWIDWASPIWTDIKESNVLNVRQARETNDERHLCPLQLDVIDRIVKVWSNPGEVVLSPFGGIGSEGYQAILNRRKYVGVELKESYWRSACRNLDAAVSERSQGTLFEMMEVMA